MGWRSGAKASLLVLGALGLGPLIADAIKRWADRNGYIDDPTTGLQWALAKVAAITDYWFFYPAASFFVGLALGPWFDALLRDRGAERKAALALHGLALRLHQTLPAVEGIPPADRLAMGSRNEARRVSADGAPGRLAHPLLDAQRQ